MKKFFLVVIISTFLFSKTMMAIYKADYGWFGEVLKSKAKFTKQNNFYEISISFKTLGIASKLSKNLFQKYTSIGRVENGILIPKKFIFYRKNNSKVVVIVYKFDYKNRVILKTKLQNSKIVYKDKKVPYFVENDILSLYFNLPHLLSSKKLSLYALEGRKKDGRIDLEVIKDRKSQITLKINFHNKSFLNSEGILYLDIDKSNWVCKKAILKNVLKIGDIKGELKKLEFNF